MKIQELLSYLENIAPPIYQESYDNAGLIVGHPNTEITGVMLCLDSTEAVLDEAIKHECNLIIAHHPIVFSGLKRLTGRNYVERVLIQAIRNNLAIYAAHTNLDNVRQGVNAKIAEKLKLHNTRILVPKQNLKKLTLMAPVAQSESIREAFLQAQIGNIDTWKQLSYSSIGAGTESGQMTAQVKLEFLFEHAQQARILPILQEIDAEKLPYTITPIQNTNSNVGSGMIGKLKKPIESLQFLKNLKKTMQTGCIRHTNLTTKKISRIAICGGAGSFLLPAAIRQKADIFITADYKYHQFFDADHKIIIADIGHYESEQYTIELFDELIRQKFSTFAVRKTTVNTNPITYL